MGNLRFKIANGDDLDAPIEVWVAGLVSMLSEDDTSKLMRAIRIAQEHRIPVAQSNVIAMPKTAKLDVHDTIRLGD